MGSPLCLRLPAEPSIMPLSHEREFLQLIHPCGGSDLIGKRYGLVALDPGSAYMLRQNLQFGMQGISRCHSLLAVASSPLQL